EAIDVAARARLAGVVRPPGRGEEVLAGLDGRGRVLRAGVAEVDAGQELPAVEGEDLERLGAAVGHQQAARLLVERHGRGQLAGLEDQAVLRLEPELAAADD